MIRTTLLLALSVTTLFSFQLNAQCNRATVIANYLNVYVPTGISYVELGWTGDASTCTPGTISQVAQTKTLTAINYFRQLCGLPGSVTFDATLEAKCQEAALMMKANGNLSHTPPSSWLCYTTDGSLAANSSNLCLGPFGSGAVSAYMDDIGSENAAVGHRRWILNSKATKFGHGSTNSSDVLWVTGNSGPAAPVNFIAYPSGGFFPAPLLPMSDRWSFSKTGADFSGSTVEMKDVNGAIVPVSLEPLSMGAADNTIVWIPTGVNANSSTDLTYSVKVANVKVNNVMQDFNYKVTVCQPVHPPLCPTGKSWSETQCDCVFPEGVPGLSRSISVTAMNPFSDKLKITVETGTRGELQSNVYDITGRDVAELPSVTENGQRLELQWDSSSWAKGMYLVAIKAADGSREIVKLMKQ